MTATGSSPQRATPRRRCGPDPAITSPSSSTSTGTKLSPVRRLTSLRARVKSGQARESVAPHHLRPVTSCRQRVVRALARMRSRPPRRFRGEARAPGRCPSRRTASFRVIAARRHRRRRQWKFMPAAISTTRIAATTKSTTMQNGGHQRVLATNWVAVLPEVLEAVARQTDHQQPRRSCHCSGGDDDETGGDAGLDGDELGRPSATANPM